MSDATARRYHHGDLPNALRQAAREVIGERGLGDFSLREVARRAGVSHTAPAHHFGDVAGLLTSLATEGFRDLADAMEHALAGIDDPVERLVVIGQTYVEFAETRQADCDVMFRGDVVNSDDAELAMAGMRAFAILDDTVRNLLDTEQLAAEPTMVTSLCWAMVQGLVSLGAKLDTACEVHGAHLAPRPDLIRAFTHMLVNGLRAQRR